MGNNVWSSAGSTDGNLAGNWSLGWVPKAGDVAYFDATSVVNCIFSAGLTCDGINVTAAYSGDGDFSDSSLTFTFASDCTFAGLGTWDRGNATIHFQGDVATAGQTAWADNGSTIILDGSNDQDVDLSGCDDADIEEDKPAGTVTLVDACDCASFTGTSGTLDVNGQTVTSSGAVTFDLGFVVSALDGSTINAGTTFSANGQTLSSTGGFSDDVPAALGSGQSWEADGVDDYVDTADVGDNSTDIAISVWVKFDNVATNWAGIACKSAGSGYASESWFLQLTTTDGQVRFRVDTDLGDGNTPGAYAHASGLVIGAWYHLLGTWSSSDGTTRLYVDGVAKTTGARTGNTVKNTASTVKIGQSAYGEYHDGHIDDIRVYDISPDAGDRATLAAGGDIATAPLAHWTLDGDFQDSSGNGNHGTLYGQKWYLNCTTSGSISNATIANCDASGSGPGVIIDATNNCVDGGGNSPEVDFGGANRRRRLLLACGA